MKKVKADLLPMMFQNQMLRTELNMVYRPRMVIRPALAMPIFRAKSMFSLILPVRRRLCESSTPMVIITKPSPRLKKRVTVSPWPILPAPMAMSKVAMAAGQGMMPPDMPSRSSSSLLVGLAAAAAAG